MTHDEIVRRLEAARALWPVAPYAPAAAGILRGVTSPPAPPRSWPAIAAALVLSAPGLWFIFSPPVEVKPAPREAAPSDVSQTERPSAPELVAALDWLVRHQDEDGSWRPDSPCPRGLCPPSLAPDTHRIGLTGLSLLALHSAGTSSRQKDAAHRAARYLIKHQDKSGRLGEPVPKFMYGHLIAALALIELSARSKDFKDPAKRALEFALSGQNPGLGWRYSPRSGDNDSSVTFWGALLLHAAPSAGLDVPKEARDGVRAWYEGATGPGGRVGYTDNRAGKVIIPGVNEGFADHPALTAAGYTARRLLGAEKAPGIDLILADPPASDDPLKVDFYYWYLATRAVRLDDGPLGRVWKDWKIQVREALVRNQCKDRADCRRGSWEPVDRWSSEGGRVYVTALGALILSIVK
jgi:hypothetical protein